jgi:tRNA A-37 threonylcarbamoyl transferase component Bud32
MPVRTQLKATSGGQTHDARSLRQAGRTIEVPFQLTLMGRGSDRDLVCREILRHLPGKRLVCRGSWGDQEDVVAKIYLDPRRAQRHYQRELMGLESLETARIPTPPVLFRGTLVDGRTPLLITRGIHKSTDVSTTLATHPTNAEAFPILSAALNAVARMHAAGLSQRDIHPGNFLLVDDTVMVIDGADIKPHGKPLPKRPSIANLGLFLAQFYPEFEIFIPDLIASYCHYRSWPPSPALTRRIEKALMRCADWREKKFLQKTLRPCTAFIARKTWRRSMVCERARFSPALACLLDNPDAAMAAGTVLKAGNSATVVKIDLAGRPLVVKRYNLKNRRHALGRALRPSRAAVAWCNANRLQFLGIATPRPLALLEERWGPLRRRAFFLSDYVAGKPIAEVIEENRENPEVLASCADQLRRLLQRLKQLRLSHSDLKASNLILAEGRLYLLDLDGMRKHRGTRGFQRAFRKDVRRLRENWRHNNAFSALMNARIREVDRYV